MRRVIIESPYAGDIYDNTQYLKRCLRDSIDCGEAPLASHLIYPFVLREDLKDERQLGIELGYEWWAAADRIVFYMDKGWSAGMEKAASRARYLRKTIEFRTLTGTPPWWNIIEKPSLSIWQRFKNWWQQTFYPVIDEPLPTACSAWYGEAAPEAGTIQSAREKPESSPENSEQAEDPDNGPTAIRNLLVHPNEPNPLPLGEQKGE